MSEDINKKISEEYKWGFESNIEMEEFPKGLNEDIVRLISKKKNEPEWLLEYRLKAYRIWEKMTLPHWTYFKIPEIDFQDLYYYAKPESENKTPHSLDDLDPELLATFEKLGIPLQEQKRISGVAIDVVFDSISLGTTWKEDLKKVGVIFCSISEAIEEYPELVQKYLGTVVPSADNYYAALNSAVFSDGSFVYIPKGVK